MLPIVEVTWYDARYRGANVPVRIAREDSGYMRRTVGYLVHEDATHIVIAMTYDGDQDEGEEDEVEDRMTIPQEMVRGRLTLKSGE